jgi:hypothetical protein
MSSFAQVENCESATFSCGSWPIQSSFLSISTGPNSKRVICLTSFVPMRMEGGGGSDRNYCFKAFKHQLVVAVNVWLYDGLLKTMASSRMRSCPRMQFRKSYCEIRTVCPVGPVAYHRPLHIAMKIQISSGSLPLRVVVLSA